MATGCENIPCHSSLLGKRNYHSKGFYCTLNTDCRRGKIEGERDLMGMEYI